MIKDDGPAWDSMPFQNDHIARAVGGYEMHLALVYGFCRYCRYIPLLELYNQVEPATSLFPMV